MHGYCYTTDRPTSVMGGSWPGIRVYIHMYLYLYLYCMYVAENAR